MECVPFIGTLAVFGAVVFRHFVVEHKVVDLAIMCGQSVRRRQGWLLTCGQSDLCLPEKWMLNRVVGGKRKKREKEVGE